MPQTVDYQELADKAVKETATIPDFAYRGKLPLGKTWAFTVAHTRDSGLLDQSNFAIIKKDMEKRFKKDVEDVRASHWAVGWMDHLAVRMLDKKGKVTKAGQAILDWEKKLDDYPVADEEDYSERESEAALSWIKSEGKLDEDTAFEVFQWLWDNDQGAVENRDDRGASPSREEMAQALKAMGKKIPWEDEED